MKYGEDGIEGGRMAWNGMGWGKVGGRGRMEEQGWDNGWDENWRSGKGQNELVLGQLVDVVIAVVVSVGENWAQL